MIVSVILRDCVRSTDQLYDYAVSDDMSSGIQAGQYVRVPFGFGNRKETAVVMAVKENSEFSSTLKMIEEIIDPIPVIKEDQLALLPMIRARYSCTYGDVVRLMVPSAVSGKHGRNRQTAFIIDPQKALSVLSEGDLSSLPQMRVLEMLVECKEAYVTEIMNALSVSKSPLLSLKQKGLIGIDLRCPEESEDVVYPEPEEDPQNAFFCPTKKQKEAICQILTSEERKEFLLFGITGSGKTEVYLHCAKEILQQGGSVLFLVPEISLTPQMIRWISERFPEKLAVLHSRLTQKERYEQWNLIRTGEAKIVVGARSAVFAPIENLRLILMDEEQDSSYKSETHPRYHARDIARMRARVLGARLVLGSATPSIETYYSAVSGYSILLCLPDRAKEAVLPEVKIVDMREELRQGNRSVLSRSLRRSMTEAIENGQQVILFLNKRGYSGLILCRACGETVMCPHCSVPMTLHTPGRGRKPFLACHYCLRTVKQEKVCPACGSTLLGKLGIGTQQLEEVVREEFPSYSVLRMDQDTTSGRDAHMKLLDAFRHHKADILIGTQMIAKGHDFPEVTVVGIISADLLIRASDFRAGERAFQLITQAGGRAGRDQYAGKVFIQTYQPEEDVIISAAAQDYPVFFQNELEYRKRLSYPPFRALGSLVLSHPDEEIGWKQVNEIKNFLDDEKSKLDTNTKIDVFGPGPAPLYRLRDRFRFRINIKAKNKTILAYLFTTVMNRYPSKDYTLYMDIDPLW